MLSTRPAEQQIDMLLKAANDMSAGAALAAFFTEQLEASKARRSSIVQLAEYLASFCRLSGAG